MKRPTAPDQSTLDALEAEIARLQAQIDAVRAARRVTERDAYNEDAINAALGDAGLRDYLERRDRADRAKGGRS